MNLTPEMLNIAKNAKTAEELMLLAKENNVEATEEEIRAYFEQTHTTGELADDELDSVAGGWCYNNGRPVITVGEQHDCFVCKRCGGTLADFSVIVFGDIHTCKDTGSDYICNCDNCKWIIYPSGSCPRACGKRQYWRRFGFSASRCP